MESMHVEFLLDISEGIHQKIYKFLGEVMQGVNEGELLKTKQGFLEGVKNLEGSSQWKLRDEKPVPVYEMEIESRLLIKASNTINVPFEKVVAFYSDPEVMSRLADNIDSIQVVYNKNDFRVVHVVLKMPTFVSNRELIILHTIQIDGNKAYIGYRSCSFPVKVNSSNVIAEVHINGFIIEKVDGGRTKVANLSDIDPKGMVPGFVKGAMAAKRAEVLASLEQRINGK
jgi:hypothetical protein